jgi:hypothetical protein
MLLDFFNADKPGKKKITNLFEFIPWYVEIL